MRNDKYRYGRACGWKHCYRTIHGARQAAKAASKKFKSALVAYSCRYCDGFHIGNVRPQGKEKRR